MNAQQIENLKKWIAALRSGKYKQTRNKLVRTVPETCISAEIIPAGHCCLGVAAEVIGKPGVYPDLWEFGCQRLEDGTLIEMNDHHRKTFAQIADYLEQNFLPLEEQQDTA